MTVGTASRNLSPDVDGSSSGEIIAGPNRMEINRGLLTRSNPFAEVLRREVLVAKRGRGRRLDLDEAEARRDAGLLFLRGWRARERVSIRQTRFRRPRA